MMLYALNGKLYDSSKNLIHLISIEEKDDPWFDSRLIFYHDPVDNKIMEEIRHIKRKGRYVFGKSKIDMFSSFDSVTPEYFINLLIKHGKETEAKSFADKFLKEKNEK